MSAYAPHDAINLWGTVAILAATLALGYAITRAGSLRISRIAAWILFVLAVVGVERLNSREPAGFRMLAIIGALLYSMKAVVAVEARALGAKPLHVRNWFCFAALWPGMRPGPFTRPRAAPQPDAVPLLIRGLVRLVCGFILVALARLTWDETRSLFITTALILPGVSFILHFGIFNLVAGLWRLAGVDCQPLFRDPLRSTSLAEFWGRRWNLAFSEMLALAVYQPLVRRAGRRPAVAVAFLGSGLLHELAISLPV
ncbi:MAG TPA: membrane bound O-acyl transferase family-domain-containing protein, partial [Isosphaeraceae bacterium]|nr:membrane bound O-acyl transferase family-domain-containing protein [Isosphaeraceae bacterium]